MKLDRYRIETAHKPELGDAEGTGLKKKASRYFGMEIEDVRTVHILTVESALDAEQIDRVRTEIFTNPVTQIFLRCSRGFQPHPLEYLQGMCLFHEQYLPFF